MKIMLVICLFFMTQCATMEVKGRALGEEKQMWIEDLSDKSIAFCHANLQEDGTSKPTCTKAVWYKKPEPLKPVVDKAEAPKEVTK